MPVSSSAGTAHFRAGRAGEAWVLAGRHGPPALAAREVPAHSQGPVVQMHSRAREVLAHSLVPEHKVAGAAGEDKRAVLVVQPAGGNHKAG